MGLQRIGRVMVDNFELIANILHGKDITEDNFFLVQVIRRHKDAGNEDMKANNIVIDSILIKNGDKLLEKKERIVKLCTDNNARAYIRLNKRSYKKVALRAMVLLAESIANSNYEVKGLYMSACGQTAEEKSFLIDIDYADINFDENEMMEYISELTMEARKKAVIHKVPTKNGYHLITTGFNREKFGMKYPKVEIHKDNPTILYIP
jgi:hypothetical protein